MSLLSVKMVFVQNHECELMDLDETSYSYIADEIIFLVYSINSIYAFGIKCIILLPYQSYPSSLHVLVLRIGGVL